MFQTGRILLLVILFVMSALSAYALDVGERAYLFTVDSSQGQVNLAKAVEKGPVVLAFYYADFSPL